MIIIILIGTIFCSFYLYTGEQDISSSESEEPKTKSELLTDLIIQVHKSKKKHNELKHSVYTLLHHEYDTYTDQKFYSKQDLFSEIGNCFTVSRDKFKTTFKRLKTKMKLWINKDELLDNPCRINEPHCERCGCTLLFATVIGGYYLTAKNKKKRAENRFSDLAQWLIDKTHLDYRVPFDQYYGTPKSNECFEHIMKKNKELFDNGESEKASFLDHAKPLFQKEESFLNLQTTAQIFQPKCNLVKHLCKYQLSKGKLLKNT